MVDSFSAGSTTRESASREAGGLSGQGPESQDVADRGGDPRQRQRLPGFGPAITSAPDPRFQELLALIQQRRAASFASASAGAQPRASMAPLTLGPVPPAAIASQAAPQAATNFRNINPQIAAFLQSLIGNQGQPQPAAAPSSFLMPQPFGGFQPVAPLSSGFGQLIAGG